MIWSKIPYSLQCRATGVSSFVVFILSRRFLMPTMIKTRKSQTFSRVRYWPREFASTPSHVDWGALSDLKSWDARRSEWSRFTEINYDATVVDWFLPRCADSLVVQNDGSYPLVPDTSYGASSSMSGSGPEKSKLDYTESGISKLGLVRRMCNSDFALGLVVVAINVGCLLYKSTQICLVELHTLSI